MTRAKAIVRAQALHRLSKDKAATVAEAELAAEHLERLRARFDLQPHEVDPALVREPPPVPAPAPAPFGPGTFVVVDGVPVPVVMGPTHVYASTATGTTTNSNFVTNGFWFG